MEHREQWPSDPKLRDGEYAQKWLRGEWVNMNQSEEEEFLLHYGTRKERKAIKKAREEARRKSD